jgi:hypothetical protein
MCDALSLPCSVVALHRLVHNAPGRAGTVGVGIGCGGVLTSIEMPSWSEVEIRSHVTCKPIAFLIRLQAVGIKSTSLGPCRGLRHCAADSM